LQDVLKSGKVERESERNEQKGRSRDKEPEVEALLDVHGLVRLTFWRRLRDRSRAKSHM